MSNRNGTGGPTDGWGGSAFTAAVLRLTGGSKQGRIEAGLDARVDDEATKVVLRTNAIRANDEVEFRKWFKRLPSEAALKRIAAQVRLAVQPVITKAVTALVGAKDALAIATLDWLGFLETNQPKKAPSYPEHRHVRVAVLVGATFIADAAIGVQLVAEHLASGYAGALGYSLGVGVVTTSIACGAAEATRQLYTNTRWKQLGAVIVLAVAAFVTLLIGLEYAQLRDVILHGRALDSIATDFEETLAHPRLSRAGWLLSLLTLSATAALWHAFFTSDDRLPGYGRVHRKWLAAKARVAECEEALSNLKSQASIAYHSQVSVLEAQRKDIINTLQDLAARHASAYEAGKVEMDQLERKAWSSRESLAVLSSSDTQRDMRTPHATVLDEGADLAFGLAVADTHTEELHKKAIDDVLAFDAWLSAFAKEEERRIAESLHGGPK